MTKKLSAEIEIKAPFYDLDPMEVVWHGNYARYFEDARCALLDKIGYSYDQMKASGFAWPIIDMHVRYIKPITFGQVVVVKAELIEHEFRLKLSYTITDKLTGMRLSKGHTVQVAIDYKTQEMEFASPPILAEKLQAAGFDV